MPAGCPDPCPTSGVPLAWVRRTLSYALNVRGFPGLDEASVRAELERSFAAWEAVQCGDAGVGFELAAEPLLTTLETGPQDAEPNQNVIVHYSPSEWEELDLPAQAFAITNVWFELKTGKIVGADMQFNGYMDPFVVCPDSGCPEGSNDLRNVATHEAGHFLGLAHTQLANATMSCAGSQGELDKRLLSADDAAGLCAAYPPGTGGSERDSGGCAVTARHGRSGWPFAALALAAAGVCARRRSRRSGQSPR